MRLLAIVLSGAIVGGCVEDPGPPCSDPVEGIDAGAGAGEDSVLAFQLRFDLADNGSMQAVIARSEGASLRIETSDGGADCPGDTVIEVFRADELFAEDDDHGVRTCSLVELTEVPAGEYRIVVREFMGVALRDVFVSVSDRLPP